MAEGVLFDVAARIIEKTGDLAVQELGLLWGFKGDIVSLGERVSTVKAVLLDAEKKEQTNQVKEWLKRLRDAIYDADDLLDDISTEALHREVMMSQNKKFNKVCICFSKSNPRALKMAHEVKAMMGRLDTIGRDRVFHLEERLEETQVRNRARETHSFVCAETIIGRENDKKAIIGILLDSNVEENVSILPIVGIGGLGKTTLAQLVFNDEEFKKHFEQKFWICVSDDFEVRVIVEKIIERAKDIKQKNLDLDDLVNELKKEIDGKRYLLVLDDVWNDDFEKWLSLKNLLISGGKGSRILVTTREEKVARIVQTMQQPYFLKGLNEQESWLLFKQMAFENGQEPKNPNIKSIGMEIIEKCRGVPLAIRSIGSLLYFKNLENDWLSFKDNELLKVANILQTLKLSYDHLPSYLKQCFAYCCLFPKDYKIHKTTLIKMWMAQGFIRSSSPNQCLEDIGHEYFMDLLWRSFFQEVEEDGKGNILQFKMHDLMHDLAKSVAASDSATFYSKEEGIHEKIRHVSFDGTFLSSSTIPVSLYNARRIRTFHLPSQSQFRYEIRLDKSTCNAIVSSFKFIRLLDLNKTRIKTIPRSIGKLRHLRYLDLSNTSIKMLPNSITRLYNLQTLRLTGCNLIKELPKDINKLVNLMYLEIDECWNLTYMPRGLGQLTKLRTLSQFVINMSTCFAFRRNGRLKELYELNELRGTLMIRELRHGKDAALESKDANMNEKKHLQDLTLSWIEEDVDESNVGYDEESLVALLPHGPPSNFQELCLIGYGGVKFPSAISSLSNLVNFSLYRCNKCQHLPSLDQFHSLKTLSLDQMNGLECISKRENNGEFSDSSFLPSLEQLTIRFCPNLKGWWQRQRDSVEEFHNHSLPSFPHLSNLYIWECPKLISLPLFPYLEKLRLRDCSLKPLEQTLRMEVINTATPKNLTSIAATSTSSSSTLAASSFIPLSKLKFMSIENMEETLPKELMCNLISLQDLRIDNCCGPLPLSRHLTALQNLEVWGSKEVDLTNDGDEMEWHGLQSLRYLWFYQLPNLAALPVGIQHLTSLQSLWIEHCSSLSAIPEWILNLTSLQTLRIWRCPILSKRCEMEAGEDCGKIEHIPDLRIDR
ncbi:putative disease resistance protein RGA3 [Quercus robur]|uniref:putative disease resistance protein RGA3 n=1 Tax=Quercus robur TaxID=38942 RepID=UPI002161D16A|nr:putative disease resistance protein RGA3 [Quercus robur]XP_050283796.1 putative disease resistance protein RGA3 [Quercus robur]XP_050283797.1 putative disease resistance protein RGA3 [Quercus robur]XP_050283798.1 putative disease resistance protein RGA3 [Quercus robur]XP_050283799.1 putative disease resistance protein RGA3 [Quercus robur]XP_050283800.1 putative disease resistance protein RGA3 [Quercus robur]